MRANEFTLTEWSHIDQEIITILQEKGYEFLGRGVDQLAFWEPSTGEILKIFGAPRSGISVDAHHDVFKTWVEYCDKFRSNPFLPKFSGWAPFKHKGHQYLQIRMERLVPLSDDWANQLERMADFVEDTPENGATYETYLKWFLDYEHEFYPPYESAEELAVHLGEDGLQLLIQTLNNLKKIARSKGWVFDLHSGNWMMRNDSTPVILDPWVERGGRFASMPRSRI